MLATELTQLKATQGSGIDAKQGYWLIQDWVSGYTEYWNKHCRVSSLESLTIPFSLKIGTFSLIPKREMVKLTLAVFEL